MAFENIVVAAKTRGGDFPVREADSGGAGSVGADTVTLDSALVDRRWAVAFGFGLIHGFGFSFALRESLQFAGSHLLTSLLSFNVGVELGQLLVLVILIPVLNFFFRYVLAERIGIILLSALVAHTGWHWATERGGQLLEFPLPTVDVEGLLTLVRLLMLMLVAAGLVWLLFGVVIKTRQPKDSLRS
jgi:hypothetical protein